MKLEILEMIWITTLNNTLFFLFNRVACDMKYFTVSEHMNA